MIPQIGEIWFKDGAYIFITKVYPLRKSLGEVKHDTIGIEFKWLGMQGNSFYFIESLRRLDFRRYDVTDKRNDIND